MGKFICKSCSKELSTKQRLLSHMKSDVCKKDFFCNNCHTAFVSVYTLNEHIKNNICKQNNNDNNKSDSNKIDTLMLTVEELKTQIKTMAVSFNNNCVINGNNNVIKQIVLVGYDNLDMSKIDKNEIANVLEYGKYSIQQLTKIIHFNPKYPEYQNVYIANKNENEKNAMLFNGEKWTSLPKDKVIAKIYNDKRNYIDENLEELSTIARLSQNKKNDVIKGLEKNNMITMKEELEETLRNNNNNILRITDKTNTQNAQITNNKKDTPKKNDYAY
jgi:hypothetical protein